MTRLGTPVRRRRFRAEGLGGVLAAILAAAAGAVPDRAWAVTSSPQVRHLVYAFTWGTTNDVEVQTSGMAETGNATGMNNSGSASGTVSSTGGASDHGTITVDVLRQQPDKGVVVSIGEQAVQRRSAAPATCVAYADLTVVCDPNKKINAEELTLLRLLGAGFVDPNDLDASRHWRRAPSGAGATTADFTITRSAGSVLTIDETRVEKESGARPETSNVNGTIVYDLNRAIPTSIAESTTMRSEQGEQYQTVKSETTLQLQSDSSPP